MAKPSNTPVLIGIALFAIVGIGVLNKAQYDARPKTEAEIQEENRKIREAVEKQAAENAAKGLQPTEGSADDLVMLNPDQYFGPDKPERTLTVGYSWTPEVQADPVKLKDAIAQFKKMREMAQMQGNKKIRLRVVNTDLYPEVATGISVDGQLVKPLSTNGDGMPSLMRDIMPILVRPNL